MTREEYLLDLADKAVVKFDFNDDGIRFFNCNDICLFEIPFAGTPSTDQLALLRGRQSDIGDLDAFVERLRTDAPVKIELTERGVEFFNSEDESIAVIAFAGEG